MKKIVKILLSLVFVVSFNSCSDSNNVIDEVLQYETGAVLRTIEVLSNTLNSSIPTSEFSVTVEEQDKEEGGLLKAVHVHVTMKDLSPDNGTTVANDAFVKSFDASEFTTGPQGLPRATVGANFGEAVAAMGLGVDDYAPGDLFVFVLKLELTDGRVFDDVNAGGIITGGFFASPFKYNALILCSPEPGTYHIDMRDNYGDGWQGGGIQTDMDGAIAKYKVPNEYVAEENPGGLTEIFDAMADHVVPTGTVSLTWEWINDSYNSECEFEVYAPNGDLLYEVIEPSPGLLPITLCASN